MYTNTHGKQNEHSAKSISRTEPHRDGRLHGCQLTRCHCASRDCSDLDPLIRRDSRGSKLSNSPHRRHHLMTSCLVTDLSGQKRAARHIRGEWTQVSQPPSVTAAENEHKCHSCREWTQVSQPRRMETSLERQTRTPASSQSK